MSDVCDFLGVQWSTDLRQFADRVQEREHATPSTAQLSRGLNRDGLEQWRRYQPELQAVLPTLDRWVQRFGY
jgi:hypothetical protein